MIRHGTFPHCIFKLISYFLNSKMVPLIYTNLEEGSTKEESEIDCFFINYLYLIFAKSARV
jgi:hypothetical protein